MTHIDQHRLLKFDLIARCGILSQAAATCVLAWFTPMSLTSRLIIEGGPYGQLALVLFTACVLAGAFDVLINDLLPPAVFLDGFRKRRHIIFHLLAGLYFVQGFVGVGATLGAEDFLAAVYLVSGVIAGWYSWAISIKGTHV